MVLVWNGVEVTVTEWTQVPVYAEDGKTVLWIEQRLTTEKK